MPTVRPRHQITETPAVARAIDLAAQRWPGEPRSRLLLRLVDAGVTVLDQEHDRARRQEAVAASSGRYVDAYDEHYLAELRRDWPE